MSDAQKSEYTVLCILPGTFLGDCPVQGVVDSFMENMSVRIADVEEVQTCSELDDGTLRVDLVFTVHDDDIPKFSITRLGTDIKWWGDWVVEHRKDYSKDLLKRFKGYEF